MPNGTTTIEEARMAQLQHARLLERVSSRIAVLKLAQKTAAKLDKLIVEGHNTSVLIFGLTLSLLKDGVMDLVLDFLFIGEIPIIGQLPGMVVSAMLVYFMWSKGMWKKKMLLSVVVLLLADNLPFAINNLPLSTIAVLWSWKSIRQRALNAETDLQELSQKTQEELEAT